MQDRRHGQFNNNNRGMHNNNRRQGFGPPPSAFANMNPQQQMAFYNMYQQQSQMMAPYMMDGGHANPFMPQGPMGMPQGDAYSNNFAMPQRQNGASLFDRIQAPPDLSSNSGNSMDTSDDTKTEDETNGSGTDKPEEVPCKFATNCTKADCPYGHPSPAAVGRNTAYVSGEKCPFGATCRNRKCTGSHPSPASAKGAGFAPKPTKIEADCKFFPNCTNPTCPFKQ
jgi:hypothetical protein